MSKTLYKGDIVAGSLMVSESRKIAELLLEGDDDKNFLNKVLKDNLLQKRSPVTAKREARLILARLKGLDSDFWYLVRDGSQEQTIQVLFCAALKQNRLLGDFVQQVIQTKIKTFQKEISIQDWQAFFEQCQNLEPAIGKWSETTRNKVRQVIFKILAQAQIINSTRGRQLLPFYLIQEIRELLERHNETYILNCLEIFK